MTSYLLSSCHIRKNMGLPEVNTIFRRLLEHPRDSKVFWLTKCSNLSKVPIDKKQSYVAVQLSRFQDFSDISIDDRGNLVVSYTSQQLCLDFLKSKLSIGLHLFIFQHSYIDESKFFILLDE